MSFTFAVNNVCVLITTWRNWNETAYRNTYAIIIECVCVRFVISHICLKPWYSCSFIFTMIIYWRLFFFVRLWFSRSSVIWIVSSNCVRWEKQHTDSRNFGQCVNWIDLECYETMIWSHRCHVFWWINSKHLCQSKSPLCAHAHCSFWHERFRMKNKIKYSEEFEIRTKTSPVEINNDLVLSLEKTCEMHPIS